METYDLSSARPRVNPLEKLIDEGETFYISKDRVVFAVCIPFDEYDEIRKKLAEHS